jgi:SAM-dependent methyltransferase
MPRRFRFDKAYYDRFYRDARTKVATRTERMALGRFVASYLAHVGQPVASVLDLGCGVGAWRGVARAVFEGARYTGVEVSRYLCREYGWEHGSVIEYRAASTYDLVICHGVLQYLSAREARRAVTNLHRLCGGALFLEALTAEDWERNCDRSVTDGDVYLRPAAWYRRELARYFTNCGGGVFLSPRSPAVLYELEKLE